MELPYERVSSTVLRDAIRLRPGERLLVLQPFGWHLDGHHMPNTPEQFSRDGICEDHQWEVVFEFGPYIAIVRDRVVPPDIRDYSVMLNQCDQCDQIFPTPHGPDCPKSARRKAAR